MGGGVPRGLGALQCHAHLWRQWPRAPNPARPQSQSHPPLPSPHRIHFLVLVHLLSRKWHIPVVENQAWGAPTGHPPRALRDPPPPAWSHSAWRGLLLRDPCGIGQVCFRAFPAQPLSTDTLVGCQVAGTIWSSPLPGYLGPGKGSASFFGEGVFSHRWAWSNHVVTIRSSPVKTIGLETAASQKKKVSTSHH